MRIERLILRNFRGFDDVELDIHPEVTALIGANGSGKTSIIDALVILFSELLTSRFRHIKALELSPRDVTLDKGSCRIAVSVAANGERIEWRKHHGGAGGRCAPAVPLHGKFLRLALPLAVVEWAHGRLAAGAARDRV